MKDYSQPGHMTIQMNLRLSRELLRLAEYIVAMKDDTAAFRRLIDDGFPEAYILCQYLGQIGYLYVYTDHIGISPDVRISVLNHARDLFKAYSDVEEEKVLERNARGESLSVGKDALKLSKSNAKWSKWHIGFTIAVAAGQIAQWIIMIIQG